jgi:hypothetical protein
VLFESLASNLVAGDTNGSYDVFIKDLSTNEVKLVSGTSAGVAGNSVSDATAISADGRYVLFESSASNLVAIDSNSSLANVYIATNPFNSFASGTDTVQSSVTFTLPDSVENLVLTGTSNIDATGNALNNSLTGNSGANVLTGSGGADVFDYSQMLTWAAGGMDVVADFANGTTGGPGNSAALSNATSVATLNGDALLLNYAALAGLVGASMGSFAHPAAGQYSTLGSGDLVNGTAANAAHAQFLYNASTGVLSFDADGTGTAVAIDVAILGSADAHPVALTPAELVIFGG